MVMLVETPLITPLITTLLAATVSSLRKNKLPVSIKFNELASGGRVIVILAAEAEQS
jgi:hypothetical protein